MRNNVTLIMTRQPRVEFVWLRRQEMHGGHRVNKSYYEVIDDAAEEQALFGTIDADTHKRVGGDKSAQKAISGQWGTVAVIAGPVVAAAHRGMSSIIGRTIMKGLAQSRLPPGATAQVEQITLAGQAVSLVTDGSRPTKTLAEFDTMERYRTNDDKDAWYVRLPSQPWGPYPLDITTNGIVAKFHEKMGIRAGHLGKCFVVRGHSVKQRNGNSAGILVHEAPNPAWLTGCIAPRLKNHRDFAEETKSCVQALDVIYKAMGTSRRCHLIIID